MIQLKLTQGQVALIDDEDFNRVGQIRWYATKSGYVQGSLRGVGNRHRKILLHRAIMRPDPTQVVDHINGDRLDNRKSNLRVCSIKENSRNRPRLNRNNSSGFRGVAWYSATSKWAAQIRVDGKLLPLGYYECPLQASAAYAKAAKEHFGAFVNIYEGNEHVSEP